MRRGDARRPRLRARSGRVARKTRETRVQVAVRLEGGPARVSTGVPFLDHMLASLATHGRFDLDVRCRGDLHVDAHAVGPGSTLNIVFAKGPMRNYRDAAKADKKSRQLLDYGLLARGIHLHPDKPLYTCTAHTAEDVDRTLSAAEDVLKRMR